MKSILCDVMSSCYMLVSCFQKLFAGIGLHTLASHDSEALTEGVVLQPGPSIVRCIKRLVLTGRKNMGE